MAHIPEQFYKAIPYGSVVVGAAIATASHHPVAVCAAVAFVAYGLYVFDARIRHRIRKHDLGHHRRCEMAHTCENRVH